MRRLVVLSVGAVLAVVLAACGLPADDEFTRIDPGDDGFGLSLASTTTVTTSTEPSTTIDATTSTSIADTTTSIPGVFVDIYFPVARQLGKVPMLLPPDPQLNQVMARILKGPLEGDLFTGMRTILPADADVTANNVGGVAVVNFPNDVFDGISPNDQRLVFGQIVLTMTSQRGVGQVRFTQGEEPMSVFLGNGSSSVATESVLRSDYTNLLGGSVDPIQTTTTTIATTVPPTDPPAVATTAEP